MQQVSRRYLFTNKPNDHTINSFYRPQQPNVHGGIATSLWWKKYWLSCDACFLCTLEEEKCIQEGKEADVCVFICDTVFTIHEVSFLEENDV